MKRFNGPHKAGEGIDALKRMGITAALTGVTASVLILSGCSALTGKNSSAASASADQEYLSAEYTSAENSESRDESEVQSSGIYEAYAEPSGVSDEEDLRLSLFRSAAQVVENEVTTGKTAEYLSYLCSFPLKISGLESEDIIIDNEDELEKFGIDRLYTDELKKALKEFDYENMELDNGVGYVGDKENGPCVVLEQDEYENVLITEFRY